MNQTDKLYTMWEQLHELSIKEAEQAWKLWEQMQGLSTALWQRYEKEFGIWYEAYVERRYKAQAEERKGNDGGV